MALQRITAEALLADWAGFDSLIDARSPAEYAADHLPGALNWPTLNDAERHEVGTLYAQVSPFEARVVGAAHVARNIAAHLDAHRALVQRNWRPLVYCWRGGQRSGSLALVLDQIGVQVSVLQGGYKAFRKAVVAALEALPKRLRFHVLCGRTGSGKSLLLRRLEAAGAQVLDLEALAEHRGSVLGALPERPQPAQKAFETRLWHALRGFDPDRTVFVESESRKVGNLHLPDALLQAMRAVPCTEIELPLAGRVKLLLAEYAHFTADREVLFGRLEALVALRGRETVQRWRALADAGRWSDFVSALLAEHYDPIYQDSMARNFARYEERAVLEVAAYDMNRFDAAARELLSRPSPAA